MNRALVRELIKEGINPEALKAALEMEIESYIDMTEDDWNLRKSGEHDEWLCHTQRKTLETYFLLKNAIT